MSTLPVFRNILFLALLAPIGSLRAEPNGPDPTEAALKRGIDFLVSQQKPDGQIVVNKKNAMAMTSLAILAMKAVGHDPCDPTPSGKALAQALSFVLQPERASADGYFGGPDSSRMYGHGIATLMFCEMLGMGTDPAQDQLIRDRAEKGIDLILRAQQVPKPPRHQGGWRYDPNSPDADLSVTVWQLMALRSAKNAGMRVPKEAIDSAVAYVKRSYKPAKDRESFTYQGGAGSGGLSTSAAGVLALQVAGEYESNEALAVLGWMMEKPPQLSDDWPFYATYYYAQAMNQRGGKFKESGQARVAELLLPIQEPDGSWKAIKQEAGASSIYATSLAVLSLAVKYHFLPIYQR